MLLEKQRKEFQMDHGQLSMVVDKFQWVFSEALLNACGKDVKFCRRQRGITPFRLGLALTATCASQRVETIADFHCGFNALFGTTVTYTPPGILPKSYCSGNMALRLSVPACSCARK